VSHTLVFTACGVGVAIDPHQSPIRIKAPGVSVAKPPGPWPRGGPRKPSVPWPVHGIRWQIQWLSVDANPKLAQARGAPIKTPHLK